METININGIDYIKASDVREVKNPAEWRHVCVIATNGWIFEGYTTQNDETADIVLTDAHVVRRWNNGLGIGGLADPAHKEEYTLDAIGNIAVYTSRVVAVIALRW